MSALASCFGRVVRIVAAGTCLAAWGGWLSPAFAQGDGPRAYFPAPANFNQISSYGLFVRGNRSLDSGAVFSQGDLDLNVGVLQYTRSLGVAGKAVGLFAIAPCGEVAGTLRGASVSPRASSSGLGDLILGGVFTLAGMPALAREDYAAFDPGLACGLLARVAVPSGEYDSSKAVNLGANRWSLQLGLPVFFYAGNSLIAPNLVTIEVLPSVSVFGDNHAPFGGDEQEQEPLFKIESHVTRNLNRAVWMSLDGLWVYGGETALDGRSDGNAQRALSLGGTVGVSLGPALSAKASYGKVVERNDDGPDGYMVRVVGAFLF